MMLHRVSRARRAFRPRRNAGFTLAEVLLSGTLGALLLTAMAYATFQFTMNVTHLEKEAGFADSEASVMRKLTRDIREAWYVERVEEDFLRIASPLDEITEYYVEDGDLKVRRPNGDVGVLYEDLASLSFDVTEIPRRREGSAVDTTGSWYQRAPTGSSLAIEVPEGGKFAMGFTVPVKQVELPGGADLPEQVLSVQADSLSLPLGWVPDDDEDLIVSLYESRAPGSARPFGSALGSVAIDGDSLPLAVWNESASAWDAPSANVVLDLSSMGVDLQAGDAYVVVLQTEDDEDQIVLAAKPFMPSSLSDDVAIQDSMVGAAWVELPLAVQLTLSGDIVMTSTMEDQVVSRVSITLVPVFRPSQTRSAAVLSQALSDDKWLGVVPGQVAP